MPEFRPFALSATYAQTLAEFCVPWQPAAAPAPKPVRHHTVRDTATGEVAEWPVYDRDGFVPGAAIHGPAIVAEAETSTLIGPGWNCRMDGLGYLELSQEIAR